MATVDSTEPIFPLDKYDETQRLRGVINGVKVHSVATNPTRLVRADNNGVAKLDPTEAGWTITFYNVNVTDDGIAPPQKVYLEIVQPVPLPLEYLGITQMKIDNVTYDVSVDGTTLILTAREPK